MVDGASEETDMKNLHRALKTICGIAGLPHAAATQRMDEVFSLARYALAELDREEPTSPECVDCQQIHAERARITEHLDRVAGVIDGQVKFARSLGAFAVLPADWLLQTAEKVSEELRKP